MITKISKLFDGVDVLMPKNIMGFGFLLYASWLFWLWTDLVREIWGRDKDPNTWCETSYL